MQKMMEKHKILRLDVHINFLTRKSTIMAGVLYNVITGKIKKKKKALLDQGQGFSNFRH